MHVLARLYTASALALAAAGAAGQAAAPCQTTAHAQFDFWLGDWDLRWTDDAGRVATGFNRITKIHDGCAIREEFDGRDGTPLRGGSISMFDRAAGKWRQVWYDNQGSWLDFEGGIDGGAAQFTRRAPKLGPGGWQRMVFHDITPDALVWDWEQSTDDGKSWSRQWRIFYTRRK